MLNFEAIRAAEVNKQPYPYCAITNSISEQLLSDLVKDFPHIDQPGSIPLETVDQGEVFKKLIEDLEGEPFRKLIAEKFDIDLAGRPIMTTLRGVMRKKDGRIHTDSKTKLITVLLYLNEEWASTDACLRILNGEHDIDDYVAEIPPLAGTMVIFKVVDNCWHGHTPVVGVRRSLQMNYLVSNLSKGKHSFFHNLSRKFKRKSPETM